MKLIGKGLFTKAYLRDDGMVELESSDPIKECMAFGWFPDSRLFPDIKSLDNGNYEMKHYPRVSSLKSSLKPLEYKKYLELRNINIPIVQNKYDGYNSLYNAFSTIRGKLLKEAMLSALEACSNYGSDVNFEISPRNVAVDKGNLILLDCFFIRSVADNIRNKKK
jgi:hypothetical protein